MPRVNRVDKSRKSPGNCGKCGTEIKAGDPYVWWKFRFGGKHIRCGKSECGPKPADLTQSEFLSTLYGIQSQNFEDCESITDLESARDDAVSDLESLRDECEEKRNNMPEQLQDSDSGNLLQGRIDGLQEMIDALQAVDVAGDDIPDEPEEPVREDKEEDAAFEIRMEAYREAHEEWEGRKSECESNREHIASELSDALQNYSGS